VPSEDAEQRVLQRPLAPVMVQYVLVVLQVLRQLVVLHQSPIESLIPLRLLLRLRIDSAGALGTSPAVTAHLRRRNGSEILAGKYLRIRLSGEIYARSELSCRSGRLVSSLEYLGDISIYIYAHRQLQSAKRKDVKFSSYVHSL
jgi:hypothetical protein